MSKCANVYVETLYDRQFAGRCAGERSFIFDEVSVDSEFKIEAGAEAFNSCSGLNSYSKSSLECCRPGCTCDWEVVGLSASAVFLCQHLGL